MPLAEFAVPDARGTSDADANVFQDDCESSRNPCPSDDQRLPACEIDPEGAIRVCDLFDKPLAISFWFTKGGDCTPTQDAFDAAAAQYRGKVNFLSVNVRDDRETVEGIIEDRGWTVPVGLDPDGAVSNLYRVGGCPTILLAYPGGILYDAEIEATDEEEIDGYVDDLIAASRRRAAMSR
jgi:thiol-disulfide isomerase/thioredoxin